MKIISLFNNKGGVGKSTLGYHLGCALGEMGKKVLFVDLDPQCNLSISAMFESELEKIWNEEDPYIEDFAGTFFSENENSILESTRTIHFLLKPIEDGQNDYVTLPPAKKLMNNVFLIPGRLSLHKFESKISERWNGLYQGEALSIRTVTAFRSICEKYGELYNCDYVIVDTSPSLGVLNKTIISTVDGFFIPTFPDMFSLYGIKNIGNSLVLWQKEFETIYNLISANKTARFPEKFVQFVGFTIYNAKKYKSNKTPNKYNLASAHYRYTELIPLTIEKEIRPENIAKVADKTIHEPIGGVSVMYSHNTYPSVAQALKCPMWKVPETITEYSRANVNYLSENQIIVNPASYGKYEETLEAYKSFARDFISRIDSI